MNVGQVIRDLRRKKSMNQIDFSEAVGISQTSLSQLETGVTYPHPATIKKIAKYCGTSDAIIYLLSIEENDVNPKKVDQYRKIYPQLKESLYKLV